MAVEWLQKISQGPQSLKCLLTDQWENKFADPWSTEVFPTFPKEKLCDPSSYSEGKDVAGTSCTISVNCWKRSACISKTLSLYRIFFEGKGMKTLDWPKIFNDSTTVFKPMGGKTRFLSPPQASWLKHVFFPDLWPTKTILDYPRKKLVLKLVMTLLEK